MISLHIEANDHFDLHAKLKGILYGLAQAPALEIIGLQNGEAGSNASSKDVNPAPEPVKRTRKPKADAPAETKPEPDEYLAGISAKAKVEAPSVDEMRAALKAYATSVFDKAIADGSSKDDAQEALNEAGLGLLQRVAGVRKSSEVPEGKRAEVIAEANRLLKGDAPSLDDLTAALNKLASAEGHGADAVFELLKDFGATNAKAVAEDKRADVIAKINEKLA